MIKVIEKQIRSWPINEDGWHVDPDSGYWVKLGHGVQLGDHVRLSDYVRLGHGVTSNNLNDVFRQYYINLGPQIFWKWVTKERKSPNFDGGSVITYNKGDIIEEKETEISDQQCDVGLHVLRPPYRPEWLGYIETNHNLMCIRVEVQPEDICFAGLPTMDVKVRVRKLKVLD